MTATAPVKLTNGHVRWPPERFYWAVLDASILPRAARVGRSRLAQRLGYLFENVLPGLAIEDVQAVYRPLPGAGAGAGPGRRYLACGAARALLQEELAPDAVTLAPQSLPEFVSDPVDPAELNLLTGPFLPKSLRKQRQRWLLQVALIAVLCAAVLMAGLERRVRATEDRIAALAAARMQVYEQVLGTQARAGAQPQQLRLTAERRRLEQTRSTDAPLADVVDCSALLTALLERWPSDVHVTTESLSVVPEAIAIRAEVPAMADAQRFADAFRALPGWLLHQPQSEAGRDAVAVTLHLGREGS